MTAAAPIVSAIKRENGVAGQYGYAATVTYPGEASSVVRFVGSTYGGPIVTVMPSGHQVLVSSRVTDRIGAKLTPAWVRAFFRSDVMRRGVVTCHRTYFLESDICDGDFPRADTRTSVHDDLTAVEAARLIYGKGLSFAATGSDWAADPDGSRVSDYAIGERCEESAHLSGFPDRVAAAIMRAVDTGSVSCR